MNCNRMKRLIPVLVLFMLFASCKKSETGSMWEKAYGTGEAFFVGTTPDSGIIACGQEKNYPYLLRLDKSKKIILDFESDEPGLFSSVWFDTSGYVTGGNCEGQMSLMRYSTGGNMLWEKEFDTDFRIDYTNLIYEGNGALLAIGTANPDSAESESAGLLFVRFDTTGQVINKKQISGAVFNDYTDPDFIAANKFTLDNNGNIYLALTTNISGGKPKACVAKFSSLFQLLWKTEIFNNPGYGSSSKAVITDGSGNVYVAGKTQITSNNGILNNSFLASVNNSGSVRWKNYLENSNEGSSLIFDESQNILMLNRNCFIIDKKDSGNNVDAEILRTFSACVSETTDAFGTDLVINYDKNIVLAGSYGGNFYLALKSLQ